MLIIKSCDIGMSVYYLVFLSRLVNVWPNYSLPGLNTQPPRSNY